MSQQRELAKPGDFVKLSSTGRNVSAVNCFLHACKKHLAFYIVTYALLFIYHAQVQYAELLMCGSIGTAGGHQ